jgi:zinc and cadmium transporter
MVNMNPVLLLALYCALSVVASLVGGWLPLVLRLTHRRMQIAISFVSGVILGVGLLHLLPHSFEALGSIDRTAGWLIGGFLFMFFLERFFHFHHHDVPDDAGAAGAARLSAADHHHDHDHDHGHGHAGSHGAEGGIGRGSVAWGGAVIGLTLHGLIDGVAIAAAVEAEQGLFAWAGLSTFLAIALHKPFDSLTIGTLMAADHRSAALRHLFNALYALVTPLGAILFYPMSTEVSSPDNGLGQALAFAAGAFVCIATSDLLPELQFHRHDRAALSIALLAGIALAWGTVLLEGGHEHDSHGGHVRSSGPQQEHHHE